MTAMLDITNAAKTFTMHLQGGVRLPVVRGVSFRVAARRMRGAVRPVRRRKIVDPEDDLRQLSLRRRPDRHASPGQRRSISRPPSRGRSSACADHTIGYVSQFLRAVPRVPALDVVAEPLIVNGMARAEARGARRRAAAPAQHSGAALGAAALDLLGRRAAARQHRARLPARSADAAAGRADRLARCRQPRRRGRADRGEETPAASRWSRSSMTTTSAS